MTENLPESPTSVTYSVVSPKGYPILLTLRDTEMKELLKKMTTLEKYFEKDGYKPQEKRSFGAKQEKQIKYVEGRACPTCGERLIEEVTKTGKKLIKCSTQKYDWATKTRSGCQFTEWSVVEVPADEMTKAQGSLGGSSAPATVPVQETIVENAHFCKTHNVPLKSRGNGIWDHRGKGELVKGELMRDEQGLWHHCTGKGWHVSANQ